MSLFHSLDHSKDREPLLQFFIYQVIYGDGVIMTPQTPELVDYPLSNF